MNARNRIVLLGVLLTASSCPPSPPPPAATPTLVKINGYGRWTKANPPTPDIFGFSTRPAEDVCSGPGPVGPQTCPARYPDTAFIDFSILSLTSFEVSSGGQVLTEVPQTAPLGDLQYRKAMMTDGSGATTTWRIAVSVPGGGGKRWCPPTRFAVDIVNVTSGQPARSVPLQVLLVWGICQSDPTPWLFATGTTGTPAASSPPPVTTGECPGGAFGKSFEVCERCGTSGLAVEKTFWGCSLSDAQQKMGTPGCTSTLRSGINCP